MFYTLLLELLMRLNKISSILLLLMAFNVHAVTNYEVRLPAGAGAPDAEPAATVIADGATNTSTTSAVPIQTGPSSKVVESSVINPTYAGWKVFNGFTTTGTDTGWLSASDGSPATIAFEFDAPIAINKYGFIAFSADGATGAPTSFRLKASDDGVSWTDLGGETNITSAGVQSPSYFSVVNSTEYTYYQLEIQASNGSIYKGTLEVYFIEAQPIT